MGPGWDTTQGHFREGQSLNPVPKCQWVVDTADSVSEALPDSTEPHGWSQSQTAGWCRAGAGGQHLGHLDHCHHGPHRAGSATPAYVGVRRLSQPHRGWGSWVLISSGSLGKTRRGSPAGQEWLDSKDRGPAQGSHDQRSHVSFC